MSVFVPRPFELEVKRLYLPGVQIRSECPDCQELVTRNLGDDCLSYPKVNEAEEVEFVHEVLSADGSYSYHEWSETIVVGMTVTVAR